MELCRLRGWAVAGMSIDYVKCFDLIPQAVVLALALELGMDPGTCRALGAMYKQLRRAFKIAGALGLWWQATNGILQGCQLSVILVNVLTTVWKWEVDSLRRQVCAQTAALPPPLDEDAADDLEPGALPPFKDGGPGYAALGSSGYADDTHAVALGATALQDTVPATEEWLGITGQDVRVDKSCSWVQGKQGAPAVLLRGVPIPLATTFHQLGVDVAIGGSNRFLMDYFPRPLEPPPPLLPYARRPQRAPARSVPLAAPQRSRPPGAGSGTQGAFCLEHGTPSCARCRSFGWGISRCCRAGHEGHAGPSGGPGCPVAPTRVAPSRQVLVPEAQRAGAAALSPWLGRARPASQALPDSGPPAARRCAAPPRVLGTRPSPALGPDAFKPAKRQAPNRADRGVPAVVSHRAAGGGAADPLSPQPWGGGSNPRPTPPAPSARAEAMGAPPGGGAAGPPSTRPVGGGADTSPPPPSSCARTGASAEPTMRQDPPQPPPPPAERPPPSLPEMFSRICPEQPRTAAAAVPSVGTTTAPTQSHQDGGGHAARSPAPPTGRGRRGRRGLPLL